MPLITDDFKKFAAGVNNVTESQKANGWVTYAKSINNTDKELINFLTDVDVGKRSIKDIDTHITSATFTTSKFGSALKSVAANMAIMFAVSFVINGITKLIQAQEQARQATEEAAHTYDESAKSIDDYTKRYQDLQQALQDAHGNEQKISSVKKDLLSLQQELNNEFGDEYGRINLVTDAYKDQTNTLREYAKAKAEQFLRENKSGLAEAEKVMASDQHYVIGGQFKAGTGDLQKELDTLLAHYKNKGLFKQENFDPFTNLPDGTFSLKIVAEPKRQNLH